MNNNTFVIPANHNVVGTCGKCGGPIITPMIWSTTIANYTGESEKLEWCLGCGAKPKKKTQIYPLYGEIKEME